MQDATACPQSLFSARIAALSGIPAAPFRPRGSRQAVRSGPGGSPGRLPRERCRPTLFMTTLPPTAKPQLSSFITYSPGKPAAEVKKEFGLTDVLKLASNENACGMSPLAREAILEVLDGSYWYPDTNCTELVDKIARRNAVPSEWVICGNGAVELIYYVAQCFLNSHDEVVTGEPSFSAYTIASRIQDATIKAAPLVNYRYDLDGLRRKITGKTKLVFIANPNNPTGTHLTFGEIAAFARKLPPYVLLVLDEAYHDFVQDPDYRGTLRLLREGRNVLILRSLSKCLGLAGLRIGYAIGQPDTIRTIRQVQVPFHVNLLAQRAAHAGLDDLDHVTRTVQMVHREKELLYIGFGERGFEFARSETNFIWVKVDVDSRQLFEKMLQEGVIIRPGAGFGAPDHVRITIGLPDQNLRVLEVLTRAVTALEKV